MGGPFTRFFWLFLALLLPARGLGEIVFTSLPNPNVYPIFLILEEGELEAEFLPARAGVAGLLALMRSDQADVCLLNREPARKMSADFGWHLTGPTITRAIHLISYKPVESREDIEPLQIIAAFPGGSPDKLFQAGGFTNQPRFTDLFLAMQLFLDHKSDALLLPEPFISQTVLQLRARDESFTVTDIQTYAVGDTVQAVNDGVVRREEDLAPVRAALARATLFIREHPEEAARIISARFEEYFQKPLSAAVLQEALASGRLRFATEVGHQD